MERVHHEKAQREKVQHKDSAQWKQWNTKKLLHEKSAPRKKCIMEIVQHKQSIETDQTFWKKVLKKSAL